MKRKLTGKELAEAEKRLVEYNREDSVVTAEEMKARIDSTNTPELIIKSEFPYLDEVINGFEPGELIVISGRPKSGKSLLLQTLTRNFAHQQAYTCWFSYELTTKQFLRCFPKLPISYMPQLLRVSDLEWLDERCWEAKLKYDIKIAMIDHLHYLLEMSRMRNPSLEIGAVLRRLKQIAIERNIVVFVVCHMGKLEMEKEPTGNDIRDSSFTLQEPDTVILIWRVKDEYPKENEAVIKVEMSRRTGVRDKAFTVKKINGWLEELRHEDVTAFE